MTDEIRNSHPTDQTDAELTTADLAGTSQKTPRGRGLLRRREGANQTHIGQIRRCAALR